MKQKILLLFFSILLSCTLCAQKETYWWYFGFNAGLTFSQLQPLTSTSGVTVSDMPTALSDGPIYTGESCFSIADKDGNFLFASDGMTVYNKNRAVMNNGTGLKGNSSSTQSGIIVPRPGADGEYFLIVCPVYNNNATWLTYSTVSLSTPEYGDQGTVINKNANLPFTGTGYTTSDIAENATVVGHADGINYWLISRIRRQFVVWEITNAGFSNPRTYQVGTDMGTGTVASKLGEIRISPDGKKVIHGNYGNGIISYGDFDPASGVISNIGYVSTGIQRCYSLEFSPSGEYLYIACIQSALGHDGMYIKKISELGILPYTRAATLISNMQQGPDGRIYAIASNNTSLWVVMNPDDGGNDIQQFNNFFPAGKIPINGLPNFIASFFSAKITTDPALPNCINTPITFSLNVNLGTGVNKVTKLIWNFGDGSPEIEETDMSRTTFTRAHSYSKPGIYTVTVTPYNIGGEILTEKILTLEASVSRCVMPVNPNVHLFK